MLNEILLAHASLLLALASGAAFALSFPNYNLALLAWISIGLLVLASYQARPAVAPLYGLLHGVVFYPDLPAMDRRWSFANMEMSIRSPPCRPAGGS